MNAKAVVLALAERADENGRSSTSKQLKLCRAYALSEGFDVRHEFCGLGTSSNHTFKAMVRFLQHHPDCVHLIVEKVERLGSNLTDFEALEDLGINIHVVQPDTTVGTVADIDAQFVHDMNALFGSVLFGESPL